MVKLSTADNVRSDRNCTVLREKGFDLHVIDMLRLASRPCSLPRTRTTNFAAHSALEILGLLAVFEARGDDWQPTRTTMHHRTKFWDGIDNETDPGQRKAACPSSI